MHAWVCVCVCVCVCVRVGACVYTGIRGGATFDLKRKEREIKRQLSRQKTVFDIRKISVVCVCIHDRNTGVCVFVCVCMSNLCVCVCVVVSRREICCA